MTGITSQVCEVQKSLSFMKVCFFVHDHQQFNHVTLCTNEFVLKSDVHDIHCPQWNNLSHGRDICHWTTLRQTERTRMQCGRKTWWWPATVSKDSWDEKIQKQSSISCHSTNKTPSPSEGPACCDVWTTKRLHVSKSITMMSKHVAEASAVSWSLRLCHGCITSCRPVGASHYANVSPCFLHSRLRSSQRGAEREMSGKNLLWRKHLCFLAVSSSRSFLSPCLL